jgi:hypothetical protein
VLQRLRRVPGSRTVDRILLPQFPLSQQTGVARPVWSGNPDYRSGTPGYLAADKHVRGPIAPQFTRRVREFQFVNGAENAQAGRLCHILLTIACNSQHDIHKECGTAVSAVFPVWPRSQAPLGNAVRGAPLHKRGKVNGATQDYQVEARYTGEVDLGCLSAFGAELR